MANLRGVRASSLEFARVRGERQFAGYTAQKRDPRDSDEGSEYDDSNGDKDSDIDLGKDVDDGED